MRISDWSSDVCSSDLVAGAERHLPSVAAPAPSVTPQQASHQQVMDDLLVGNAVEDQWVDRLSHDVQALIASDNREARLHLRPRELGDLSIKLEMQDGQAKEIGRASCRARVCQYV